MQEREQGRGGKALALRRRREQVVKGGGARSGTGWMRWEVPQAIGLEEAGRLLLAHQDPAGDRHLAADARQVLRLKLRRRRRLAALVPAQGRLQGEPGAEERQIARLEAAEGQFARSAASFC